MGNLNVAAVGTLGYAKDLGKKGTVSDITIYDIKKGQDTVSILEPAKYPERINSLYFCVNLAEMAIVVVDEINAAFGETLLMLDCANVKRGVHPPELSHPGPHRPTDQGHGPHELQLYAGTPIQLREFLLDEASKVKAHGEGKGIVPIDHHFKSRGGHGHTGLRGKGVVNRHDNLKVLPTERTALVRSIQKHDDDFDIAYKGDRVGFALKGIEAEELDRGYVLTNDPEMKVVSELNVILDLVKYWQSPSRRGWSCTWGTGCSSALPRYGRQRRGARSSGDVKPGEAAHLRTWLRAVMHYLEGGKLRIVGTVDL